MKQWKMPVALAAILCAIGTAVGGALALRKRYDACGKGLEMR